MDKNQEYFKGVSVFSVAIVIGLILGLMIAFGGLIRAETPEEKLLKTAPNGNEWTTQILYDTVNACYQGTIKWIMMNNPQLIGTIPPPMVQRRMVEHCFCVLDKIRVEYPLSKYIERVFDGEFTGQLFMAKALECASDQKTLDGLIEIKPDNETKTDNETIIETEPKQEDSKEESLPDQPKEKELNVSPETIFQG